MSPRSRAARCGSLGEGRAAHGQDQLGIAGLNGRDGIAGVGRAPEGPGAVDRQHFGNLHHVEQGCNTWGDVLAVAGGRSNEGIEVGHQRHHQRRHVLGQRVGVGRVIGLENLGYAGNLRRSSRGGVAPGPGNQRSHFTQLPGNSDGRQRCVLDRCIVVFDPNERLGHQANPISLSLATSASTSGTLMPACRAAGSLTLSVLRRGAVSMP